MKAKMAGMMERGTGRFLLMGALSLALGAAQTAQAATKQSFVWVGSTAAQSEWATGSCWMYHNGSTWKTTTGNPGGFSYDTYFRSPMTIGGQSYSFNGSWDRVVTFSGARRIGTSATDGQPLHIDAGSTAASPIVFTATTDDNGLSSSSSLLLGETNNGYLKITRGTYKMGSMTIGQLNGYAGELSLDPVTGGNVTLETTGNGNMLLGTLSATNATLTCGGSMDTYAFAIDKKNGDWEMKGRLYVGCDTNTVGTFNNDGGSLTVRGGLFISGNVQNAKGSFYHHGGDITVVGQFRVGSAAGSSGYFTMDDGTMTASNNVYIGCNDNAATSVFTLNGGSFTCNGTTYLPYGKNVTGQLYINGGTFTAAGPFAGGNGKNATSVGIIELNGSGGSHGTLATKGITLGSGAIVTLKFDGGELKAMQAGTLIADGIAVTVGANGANVNTDGKAIAIAEPLTAVSGTAGGLTVTGGGTLTASGNLAGEFTVGDGTTLRYFDQDGVVSNYTVSALNIGVGAMLCLDADATGCDTFSATTTNITATAENPAIFKLIVRSMPESGRPFPLFAMDAADTNKVNVIVETSAGATLEVLKGYADGCLTYMVLARDYIWNDGSNGGGWTDGGKWNVDGVAATWQDNNNAVFANAGDVAAVDGNVTAVKLDFQANATVNAADGSSATFVAPQIEVASGVSAAVNVPVAGSLEKTGTGTLTLTQSRSGTTTLSGGTLVLSGDGVTLDSTGLVLNGVASPVTLRLENDAAFTAANSLSIGTIDGATARIHNSSDWTASGTTMIGTGLNSTNEYYHEGGTLSLGGELHLIDNIASTSSSVSFEISGGVVTNTSRYVCIGMNGDVGSRAIMTVKSGAKYGGAMGLVVGYNGAGTLNVDGGEVSVANNHVFFCYSYGNETGEDCYVNVTNGGLIVTRAVGYGYSSSQRGSANAVLTLDDGTLKASPSMTSGNVFIPDEPNLSVVVGLGGGTIDTTGKSLKINKVLSGTGGMTFMGGGMVTLSDAPAYSGTTTVAVGTMLVVPEAIAGTNLVFVIPEDLASGVYKVVASRTAFADDVLSAATLPAAAEGAGVRFFMNADKTEIWCAYANFSSGEHVWVGGTSGSLNDGVNWLPESVPTNGTVLIASADAATLTNPDGSGFAATRIVFPADTAPVTISGAAISGVDSIANNSTSQAELMNEVTFSGNIDVVQNTGAIKFTGGATGKKLARTTDIHGTYTLTVSGDHTEFGDTVVKSDGVYLLPNACFFKHNGDFTVEAGGRAEVKDAKIDKSSTARLLKELKGEFKVDNEFCVMGNATHYMAITNGNTATFIANRIRPNQNGIIGPIVSGGKTIIGEGGIIRGAGYVRVADSGSHEFGSYADWTMYYSAINAHTDTGEFAFYKQSSSNTWSKLTFDTTDWYDSTIGRTITCEAPIGAADVASAAKFKVNVKGIGKFVFANTSNGNIFSGGLTVSNSATVAVMANAWPGKGEVTLADTSTLQMAQSGNVTIGGALSLAENATLAFNFTDKSTAPTLTLASGSVAALPQTVNVRVSAANGMRPRGGDYTLTSGIDFTGKTVNLVDEPEWVRRIAVKNGNLILTAQRGTSLFVR